MMKNHPLPPANLESGLSILYILIVLLICVNVVLFLRNRADNKRLDKNWNM